MTIAFLAGLIAGIAVCEIAGRKMHGYSVVMETVAWARSLG